MLATPSMGVYMLCWRSLWGCTIDSSVHALDCCVPPFDLHFCYGRFRCCAVNGVSIAWTSLFLLLASSMEGGCCGNLVAVILTLRIRYHKRPVEACACPPPGKILEALGSLPEGVPGTIVLTYSMGKDPCELYNS